MLINLQVALAANLTDFRLSLVRKIGYFSLFQFPAMLEANNRCVPITVH